MSVKTKQQSRLRRRRRVRARVRGTAERPRLAVFRSNRGVIAQLIDDDRGHTLAAFTWTERDLRDLGPKDLCRGCPSRTQAPLRERRRRPP